MAPADADLEELVYCLISDVSAVWGYHHLAQQCGSTTDAADPLPIIILYSIQ